MDVRSCGKKPAIFVVGWYGEHTVPALLRCGELVAITRFRSLVHVLAVPRQQRLPSTIFRVAQRFLQLRGGIGKADYGIVNGEPTGTIL